MCGILYTKLKKNNPAFYSVFKEALALMSYRGPDNITAICENNDYFGHVRLSILDLSPRSNQPIVSDNYILLFKGEVYNYKSLDINAPSDTLAIASLIENKIDIVDKLAGMYAVLRFDKKIKDVYLLRDFYGEKPVYYYHDEEIFIVSSTIKSILHILNSCYQKKLTLNSHALYEYLLSGYVREPKTIYNAIHMLEPAHSLSFTNDDWHINITNHVSTILANPSVTQLEHIKNCISTTDVTPSLLLSSGVDSTYLLNYVNETNNDCEVLSYQSGDSEYDESVLAKKNFDKICANRNVNFNFIENHENLSDLYALYPTLLEQPTSDGMNLFNILHAGKRLNPLLKLVLIGTGGDELYGGYHSFKNYRKISSIRQMWFLKTLFPEKYRRFFTKLPKQYNVEAYYFLYRICPTFLSYISKNVVEQTFRHFVKDMQKFSGNQINSPFQKIKLLETFDYMRNQLLRDADNISLFCGYEARNPILSISAFLEEPDSKQSMKALLFKNHGITFGAKKGFTLCDNNKMTSFLLTKIRELNHHYPVFPTSLINKLPQLSFANFYVIRKMYILLAWFAHNNVSMTQLNGFHIAHRQ